MRGHDRADLYDEMRFAWRLGVAPGWYICIGRRLRLYLVGGTLVEINVEAIP
jgi:hypothetical protein